MYSLHCPDWVAAGVVKAQLQQTAAQAEHTRAVEAENARCETVGRMCHGLDKSSLRSAACEPCAADCSAEIPEHESHAAGLSCLRL